MKRGFTLIELLVVIAIIGLLASIILVFFGNIRDKARDAKRKAELYQINLAIEMYYQAKGYYPNPGGDWCHSSMPCWDNLENELRAENVIRTLARDPINNCSSGNSYGPYSENCYSYVYIHRDGGYLDGSPDTPGQPKYYDLITRLENENDRDRCQLKCYKSATLDALDANFCPGGDGFPNCPNCPWIHYRQGQNELFSAKQ